jgi:hypothetical protein
LQEVGVEVVDRVEASKNLEILKANQARLINYNQMRMRFDGMAD